jgi:proline iminopeptidase
VLEERLSLAPCASREMLVDGVFGAFENDEEFRLVMFALGPLYSESYDPNSALKRNLETVFRARTHSEFRRHLSDFAVNVKKDNLYSKSEKYFDYRDQLKHISAKTLVLVGEKDWICPPGECLIIRNYNLHYLWHIRSIGTYRGKHSSSNTCYFCKRKS